MNDNIAHLIPPPVPEDYAEVRVDGKKLYATDPVVLPAVCVKCGRDATNGKAIKKKMVYVPRWTYVFLLAGLLPAAVMMMVLQKKANVTYSLCRQHLVRWRWVTWTCLFTWLLFPALLISGGMMGGNEILLTAGGVCFVLALILSVAVAATAPVGLSGYDDPYFTIKGPRKPFVEYCRREFGARLDPETYEAMYPSSETDDLENDPRSP